MNKKGNISLEALISVPVFIIFATFLVALIHFIGLHDIMSQEVLKELEMVSHYNYAYECIGEISLEDLGFLKDQWPPELNYLLEEKYSDFQGTTKTLTLKGILSLKLKSLEKKSNIENVKVKDFQLEDDILNTLVTYDQMLPLGFKVTQTIETKQQLWFLGDDKSLIDLRTLEDLLREKKKNMKTAWCMLQKQVKNIM